MRQFWIEGWRGNGGGGNDLPSTCLEDIDNERKECGR